MILKIKRFLVYLLAGFSVFWGFTFANEYILFYGQGCPHCEKVERYIQNANLSGYIIKREVFFHAKNQEEFNQVINRLNLPPDSVGVPFLYIKSGDNVLYKMGDEDVINYLKQNKQTIIKYANKQDEFLSNNKTETNITKNVFNFLLIMIPAAISDSINPCAFAVMLILLASILCKHNSRKKVYLAGFAFSLSIFISYFLMGVGLYKALASVSNTMYLKIGVGILGILVGLANLKDFFWYGKGFVMEVPFSWRPKLKKILDSVTSPAGAFVIGFLVSLFLLPCTSGPYVTILGFLASEHSTISVLGYFYLFLYNLIFILPMILITLIVGSGVCSTEYLLKQKEKNIKVIHLIVGLLMLGLGIYVIMTI